MLVLHLLKTNYKNKHTFKFENKKSVGLFSFENLQTVIEFYTWNFSIKNLHKIVTSMYLCATNKLHFGETHTNLEMSCFPPALVLEMSPYSILQLTKKAL